MGEGPGERSGFGEFFVFVLGFLWVLVGLFVGFGGAFCGF